MSTATPEKKIKLRTTRNSSPERLAENDKIINASKVQVTRAVIVKILFFTFLMFTLPIITYFYSLEHVFQGETTYSAISAALMANLVLAGYIFAAYLEDVTDRKKKVDGKND